MKSLILFASKSGATKECAELLSKRIGCPTLDLTQQNPKIDLSEFDILIIGTGVRMGKIYKPVKTFILQNINVLLAKKTAIFFL